MAKKNRLSFTNVGLALSLILWPVIIGIFFYYLQNQLIFHDGYGVPMKSLLKMVSNVMFFRILIALLAPAMLLVFARVNSKTKPKIKIALIWTYIVCVTGLALFFFPYSFWKARLIKPPPGTFEKSYRYKITSLTEPSETELRFKSHTNPKEVLDYYYNLLKRNDLCLGVQSLIPERRCFPKNIINPADKSWNINTTFDPKRKTGGLNWGFVHYIGETEEGDTLVKITLNNDSK